MIKDYNLNKELEDKINNFFREMFKSDIKELAKKSLENKEEYIKTEDGTFYLRSYYMGNLALKRLGERNMFFDNIIEDIKKKEDIVMGIITSAPAMLERYFILGKQFKIKDGVFELLENTTNKIYIRKSPFDVWGIDRKMKTKYEGLNILFVIFSRVINPITKEDIDCNYIAIGEDTRDESNFFIKGRILENNKLLEGELGEGKLDKKENLELRKIIRLIYANFLDYLNHPYCIQNIYKLSDNNWNRINRGKFPLQDKIIIDIKREFINMINKGNKNKRIEYKNKFWVRGHFRHFRNIERYKNIYSNKEKIGKGYFINGEYLSKWILPYIKGIGELKDKIRVAN
jgi:hypothetical protein